MITNIAAYKFTALTDLVALKEKLKSLCLSQGIRGTILLSPEGINLMLAGTKEAIALFVKTLTALDIFANIHIKYSYSDTIPFQKHFTKIKPELIPLGFSPLEDDKHIAEHLAPQTFKKWLDDKADITVLDTRNHFEVEIGAFAKAIDPNINHFRHFSDYAKSLDPTLKKKPMVIYCTGGIRCEKAGHALIEQGFEQVYQLEGGILNYFEQCGGAHFDGDCFVFDERVALNSKLEPVHNNNPS